MKTNKIKEYIINNQKYYMSIIFFDDILLLLENNPYHQIITYKPHNLQNEWKLINIEENIFLALYPISKDDIKSELYFKKSLTYFLNNLDSCKKQIRILMIGKKSSEEILPTYYQLQPHFIKRFFQKPGIIKIPVNKEQSTNEQFPFSFFQLFMKPNKSKMFEKEFQRMEKQNEIENYILCLKLMYIYLTKLYSKDGNSNHLIIFENEAKEIKTLQDIAKCLNKKNQLFLQETEQMPNYSYYTSILIRYIRKNYSNKDLTPYQMADHLGISVSRMRTVFKEETGKPINRYLSEVRLKNVCNLLLHSNETIEKIAQISGYLDGKNLRRVFKQNFGITPSEYRYNHRIL